jgi:hypothetical protein
MLTSLAAWHCAALPHVKIEVDKWLPVALANQMVIKVRQRVARDPLGRRTTMADPVWVRRWSGGAVGGDDPPSSS